MNAYSLSVCLRPIRQCVLALIVTGLTVLGWDAGRSVAAETPSTIAAVTVPADPCRVGAYITGLGEFDLVRKSFQIEFWMWAISPTLDQPLKTIEVVGSRETKAQYDSFETSADPYQNFGADRQVFHSSRKFTATPRYSWDETNYPFDRHVLLVEMEDPVHDNDRITFLPDARNTKLRKGLVVDGWRVENVNFTVSNNLYDTTYGDPTRADGESAFSHLTLAISIDRESRMTFWKLTVGVYGAVVIMLLAFFFDSAQPSLMSPRTSLVAGALFAAIVNMRASESVLGHAENLTLVDKIHILSIVYIFLGALALVSSRLLFEAGRGGLAMSIDRRVLFPLTTITVLIANAALVWQAIYVG